MILTWLSAARSASILSGEDLGVTKWSTSSAEWLCDSAVAEELKTKLNYVLIYRSEMHQKSK